MSEKAYVITAGEYSCYRIISVFVTEENAIRFMCEYNRQAYEKCRIEEYPIGADFSKAGKDLYVAIRDKYGNVSASKSCDSIFDSDYYNKIGKVENCNNTLLCYIAIDAESDYPEQLAIKIASDLFTKYIADKIGV